MDNIVIIITLVLVFGLSIAYIVKAKKNGAKCIGCPSSHDCKTCGCGCHEHVESEN